MTSSLAMVSTRNILFHFRIYTKQIKRTMMSDSLSDSSSEHKPTMFEFERLNKAPNRSRTLHVRKEKAISASCKEVEIGIGLRVNTFDKREDDTKLASSRESDGHSQVRRRRHDSESESEVVCNLRRELKLSKRKEVAYERQIRTMEFELSAFKAIVRQYQSKAKKVCNLAMVSVTCEDRTVELGNSRLERELVSVALKSDIEDDETQNRVSYSYIDNVL